MSVINSNEINESLFLSVTLTALEAVKQSKLSNDAKARWERAINAAAAEVNSNPYFKYEDGVLIVLSDTSTNLYEVRADGYHVGCRAYERGFPCRHRALRRLLDLYSEAAQLPRLNLAHHTAAAGPATEAARATVAAAAVPPVPVIRFEGAQPKDAFAMRNEAPLAKVTQRGERWAGSKIEY